MAMLLFTLAVATNFKAKATSYNKHKLAHTHRAQAILRSEMTAIMTAPEGINTHSGRLATFESVHQLAKRRASNAKKKTQTTVSWPHESPKPVEVGILFLYA
jgi:hypothetical protein